MAQTGVQQRGVIPDSELDTWLQSGIGGERELIVEARLPARKLSVRQSAGRKLLIQGRGSEKDRSDRLRELWALIAAAVATEPVLLNSAGAVAVRATPVEVRKFAGSPLIRAIRPNRRLARAR